MSPLPSATLLLCLLVLPPSVADYFYRVEFLGVSPEAYASVSSLVPQAVGLSLGIDSSYVSSTDVIQRARNSEVLNPPQSHNDTSLGDDRGHRSFWC